MAGPPKRTISDTEHLFCASAENVTVLTPYKPVRKISPNLTALVPLMWCHVELNNVCKILNYDFFAGHQRCWAVNDLSIRLCGNCTRLGLNVTKKKLKSNNDCAVDFIGLCARIVTQAFNMFLDSFEISSLTFAIRGFKNVAIYFKCTKTYKKI